MSYQVLARKWRPKDFSGLVGQDHVVTALRNALADDRVAQAYLFSGIRGVGKTSAARLLAKALNCRAQDGPAPEPCNECDACREIGSGASMDVVEVDAATYSKVEQVRELTETLRYGPANNRYKVVVLDEVHRLSRQAFDALLKIVEEPPAHLVFIFATTEIDAVPATILSRCQEFQFRRVPSPVVAEHLRRLADAEEIDVSDNALRLVARAGEGSVRDSVALLDQMSTFGGGKIADEDAAQLLGGFDAAVFLELLGAILEGDGPTVTRVARDVDSRGWDPHHVYGQFLTFCRDGLHLAMGGDPSSVDLPGEEAESLAEAVRSGGYEGLLQVLQLLLTSEAMVRRSEFGSVALEVAWLRAAELPKVRRIETLLGSGETPTTGGGGSPGAGGGRTGGGGRASGSASTGGPSGRRRGAAPTRRTRAARPTAETSSDDDAADEGSPRAASEPATTATSTTSEAAPNDEPGPQPAKQAPQLDDHRLPDLLDLVASRRQSLAALLRDSSMGCRDGRLVIAPREGDRILGSSLRRRRNGKFLDEALAEVFGREVEWRLDPKATDLPPAPAATPTETETESETSSEPTGPPLAIYEEDMESASPDPRPTHARRNGSSAPGPVVDEAEQVRLPTTGSDGEPLDEADLDELPVAQRISKVFRGNILHMRDRERSSTPEETRR